MVRRREDRAWDMGRGGLGRGGRQAGPVGGGGEVRAPPGAAWLAAGPAAMGAGHAMLGTEVMVQIGEDGAWNMRLQVLGLAGRRLGQVEAAVEDHQRTAAGMQRGQLLDGDRGLVGLVGGVGSHGCGTPKACAGGGAPAAKNPIPYATAPRGAGA